MTDDLSGFLITDVELRVLELLGAAAKAFWLLPDEHPSDSAEFVAAVHAAQNIVLARPGYRQSKETATIERLRSSVG